MDEVVASVKLVTAIISEIAIASSEQNSGIEQINQAIMQMDDGTQQNAALVEEAAAAAEAQQGQAANLATAVSVFRLAEGHAAPVFAGPNPKRPPPMPARTKSAAQAHIARNDKLVRT